LFDQQARPLRSCFDFWRGIPFDVSSSVP
jgi:hypothetical protein